MHYSFSYTARSVNFNLPIFIVRLLITLVVRNSFFLNTLNVMTKIQNLPRINKSQRLIFNAAKPDSGYVTR